MKINRDNYEEYFILYADNELGSDDRRMVEEFANLNPDLKDELDTYLSTVLLPDTFIGFENKEELQRHDESLISYIDNELPAAEKSEFEKLVTATPSLQKELELYRKTKLQPETDIAFENKSVLYRSTERRVVRMTWVRWAAAAVILLAVSITAITVYNNNKSGGNEVAVVNPENINPKSETPVQGVATGTEKQSNQSSSTEEKKDSDNIDRSSNKETLVKTNDKQKNIQPKNNAPVQPTLVENKNEAIALNTQPGTNNLPNADNNPNSKIINEGIAGYKPDDIEGNVKPGSYTSTNVTGQAADTYQYTGGVINPDEDGGQNKKSRGLFRKLTRVFEKGTGIKATSDDDKLHIAAFTVKLK